MLIMMTNILSQRLLRTPHRCLRVPSLRAALLRPHALGGAFYCNVLTLIVYIRSIILYISLLYIFYHIPQAGRPTGGDSAGRDGDVLCRPEAPVTSQALKDDLVCDPPPWPPKTTCKPPRAPTYDPLQSTIYPAIRATGILALGGGPTR